MTERLLGVGVVTAFLLIPWVLERGQGIFAPLRTYSILSFITTVPYLVLLAADPSVMNDAVAQHIARGGFDDAFMKYVFVQALAYLCVFSGYLTARGLAFGRIRPLANLSSPVSERATLRAAFIAAFLGVVFWLLKLENAGGFTFLLLNLTQRTQLTAGFGYVSIVADVLLALGVLLIVYSFQYGSRTSKKVYFVVFFVVSAFCYSTFGGRKHLLQLILMVLLTWHFFVRRINSVRVSHLALAGVVVFYFIGVLLLRQLDAMEYYINRPQELFSDVFENINLLFVNLSYADTYIFIIHHFDQDGYWWGRSFLDLLYAPIPSTVMDGKPPVDDGVYIRSLADGMRVQPPTPFADMYPSSFPPETIGNGYANAGLVGVVFGMSLLGMICRFAYAYMQNKRTFLSLYIFLMVLLNFQLTNLRIVQFMTSFVIVWVFCRLFVRATKRRRTLSRARGEWSMLARRHTLKSVGKS